MDTQQLITKELALINRMFQQSQIKAKVTANQTILVEVGYVSYGLTLAMSEKFSKVEALHRELSALVSSHRQRSGMPATQVMPVTSPRLALEVAHPSPKKLLWSPRKVTAGAPHAMAIGRSYGIRPKDEQISFERVPHILIAGMTDAGKTMLLHTMLLSLCAATSPADLRVVLVDLKNEDLAPFEHLPHILTFAGTKAAAVDAIRFVVDEKDRRIEQRGYKPYRLVLVVDEMMQLAGNSEVRDMLGDLASIGRSKLINLIGATQHPTEKGGLGTLLGANFGARLVGRVAPGNSFAATRRPQIHADLLPGRGSFLRIEGPDVVRFQSYFIDTNDVDLMVEYISKDVWGGKVAPLGPSAFSSSTLPSSTGEILLSTRVVEAEKMAEEGRVEEKVEEAYRDDIDEIADMIAGMYAANESKNKMSKHVFGKPFGGSHAARIDAAIKRLAERGQALPVDDGKIIQLRRAS